MEKSVFFATAFLFETVCKQQKKLVEAQNEHSS